MMGTCHYVTRVPTVSGQYLVLGSNLDNVPDQAARYGVLPAHRYAYELGSAPGYDLRWHTRISGTASHMNHRARRPETKNAQRPRGM